MLPWTSIPGVISSMRLMARMKEVLPLFAGPMIPKISFSRTSKEAPSSAT